MVIVRRRLDPTRPPRLSPESRARLATMTDAEIERKAGADADNPPMTDEEFARDAFARDVRRTREETALTQTSFADRYHIALSRLRDWEQERYSPDSVAVAYIKTIRHDPKAVARALAAG